MTRTFDGKSLCGCKFPDSSPGVGFDTLQAYCVANDPTDVEGCLAKKIDKYLADDDDGGDAWLIIEETTPKPTPYPTKPFIPTITYMPIIGSTPTVSTEVTGPPKKTGREEVV